MATVPSNLIPVRVTQLPDAPTASEDTLLVGVYAGVTYKIRAGDLLNVAGVPLTRQVIAGTGLTGGGQLSSNVTLSVAPGGIGPTQLATTGVTPGVYGDSGNVPQLTVDATGRVTAATTVPFTVSGYVPDTRQVIAGNGLLGGGALNTNVTLSANYGSAAPLPANGSSGSAGTALTLSRSDHRHPAVDLADQAQVDGILPLDQGGTGRSLTMQPGAVVWSGGDGLYVGTAGVLGQVLVSGGSGAPTWGSALVVSPQLANTVFAGPAAGSAADPTFRALVNADIPTALDSKTLTNVDVNSGTIDGTAIGASVPAAGTFTTANATTVGTTNLEVTNLKAGDGTAAGSIANATGVVTLNSAVLTTADINGGTVDNTVIGSSTPSTGVFTQVDVDNLRLDGNTLSSTNTNGNITLDPNGTGEVVIPAGVDGPLYIDFNTTQSPLPTDATGRLYYDSANQFQTLVFQMNGSVVQKIGEEQFYRVKCSGAVTKGQVVMFAGTLGASGGLVGAAATGLTPVQSNYILGVAAETGANNDWIFVTSFGEVKNLNTTGGAENWQQGDELYYNPLVTGGLTKFKPSTPNAIAQVAAVVHVGSSNGILFVRPTFGSVLGGTDGNVQFGTLSGGDVIVYDSGDSRWENRAQSTLSVGSATTATNLAAGAANQLPYQTGAGATSFITAPTVANTYLEWSGSAFQWSANPLGTVTSVGLALPAEFTVSNSPVTSSGTLTGAWATQAANYVLAGPTTGPAATPSFRALVAADVPTLNQNTTGSAASLSISGQVGLLTFTGLTSTNRVKTVRDADDTVLELGGSYTPTGTWNWTTATATWPTFNQNTTGQAGSVANALTAGTYLTSTGTFDGSVARTFAVDATSANTASKVVARDASGNFAAGTITASLSGNAATATTATNLAGGAASQLPYQSAAGTTSFIANGTAGQVLTSAGAGVPVWSGISGGTF